MQVTWLTLIFVLYACSFNDSTRIHRDATRRLYEEFKRDFNKQYKDNDEDNKRFEIFRANLKRVEEYRMKERGSAEYGITQLSDLTKEEFLKYYANAKVNQALSKEPIDFELKVAPKAIDWREKGAVRPVEDQGACGSCWAFSAVGNIEGQWSIKKRENLTLSKQQVLDCDVLDGSCNGGIPLMAYSEIRTMGGLEVQKDYPYIGYDQDCVMDKRKIRAYINDSVTLPADENKQAEWLSINGPISVCLNANPLQFYKRGVIRLDPDDCDVRGINHAVLTVGYNVENEMPYWIVKNSWSSGWGEAGYFRIYRGEKVCGIERLATSAVIN